MQERFETFTVLINRISRDIRRIRNQEMAAYHLRQNADVACLVRHIFSGWRDCGVLRDTGEEDTRRPFPVRWSILKVTDLSSGILERAKR